MGFQSNPITWLRQQMDAVSHAAKHVFFFFSPSFHAVASYITCWGVHISASARHWSAGPECQNVFLFSQGLLLKRGEAFLSTHKGSLKLRRVLARLHLCQHDLPCHSWRNNSDCHISKTRLSIYSLMTLSNDIKFRPTLVSVAGVDLVFCFFFSELRILLIDAVAFAMGTLDISFFFPPQKHQGWWEGTSRSNTASIQTAKHWARKQNNMLMKNVNNNQEQHYGSFILRPLCCYVTRCHYFKRSLIQRSVWCLRSPVSLLSRPSKTLLRGVGNLAGAASLCT